MGARLDTQQPPTIEVQTQNGGGSNLTSIDISPAGESTEEGRDEEGGQTREPKTVLANSRNPSPKDWSFRGIFKSLGRILTGYDLIITAPDVKKCWCMKLFKSAASRVAEVETASFENLEEEMTDCENRVVEEVWPCRIPFNFPIFIIFISFLEWLCFQYITTGKLKSFLEYQPFRRFEIWRFYTEMFIHGSSRHLWGNLKSQLIVGSCLEIVHGWKRVGLLYVIGVVFGNLSVSILSPMKACFGASGGVLALITAHLASFTLNWNEMTNPLPRTLLILSYIALQIYATVFRDLASSSSGYSNVAHAAHFGGALAGFIIGMNILKNFRRREKDIKWGRICHQIATIYFFACVGANVAMQMFLDGFYVEKKDVEIIEWEEAIQRGDKLQEKEFKMAFLRNAFKNYPLVSNCVIYGTLYVTAEFSQQTILKKVLRDPATPEPPYNTHTLKSYAVVGTCAMSPTLFYWYKWLDRKFVGTATKIVVKKCLLDQFLMTPQLLAIFYVSMSLLEGKKDLFGECRQKFVPTFVANSVFWMPIQALNFLYIPSRFRVVYIGCCTLVWVNILCWFKRK